MMVATKKDQHPFGEACLGKLQLIDDTTCDLDLRSPPSNHFKKLLGTSKGRHSIRINKQWRLIFSWDETTGKAAEIYLDNHDYR